MARTFAGILGLLAFATVLARSLIHNTDYGNAIWQASVMLFAFAGLGFALGLVAQWLIDDSVRGRLTNEITVNSAARPDRDAAQQSTVPQ
jgi:hypothetical protein